MSDFALFAGIVSPALKVADNLPLRISFDFDAISIRVVGEEREVPMAAYDRITSLAAYLERIGVFCEVMERKEPWGNGKVPDMIVIPLKRA